MPKVHALFWFDVEDCTVPQSDDCAKRLAQILTRNGVRGTFKVVGQKARTLEQRIRFDVIDALRLHDIGFHSNWHGLRPQIAEYLAPLDFDDGAEEFERREGPGLDDVRRLFGEITTTYGQPGSNWAPQVFESLRRWDIPTYVSGFGYVGVDCQPFWYGGVLCTSHMSGRRFSGETQSHYFGLNFELGKPGELAKHQERFSTSLRQLAATGGLISLANHPCCLVLEEWFSTYLKPRELTEAGYEHFETFVKWALAQDNVATTCAGELLDLYPDRAAGHDFGRDELLALADELGSEIGFHRLGDVTVSAAEAFGLLANALAGWLAAGAVPDKVGWRPVHHPRRACYGPEPPATASWSAFAGALDAALRALNQHQVVPDRVPLPDGPVPPERYLAALARVMATLLRGGEPPEVVRLEPVERRFEDFVDQSAAEGAWRSVMMPAEFAAPNLLELARLGAWTLKPAVLVK